MPLKELETLLVLEQGCKARCRCKLQNYLCARNDANTYKNQILKVQERLLSLQEENKKRSLELSNALNKIKCTTSERAVPAAELEGDMNLKTLGFSSMKFSSLYYHLPHLRAHENNIYPNIIFGKNRTGVSVVMGVPTIKREKESYLIRTLTSLFFQMSRLEEEDCLVVIFVAEVDETYINDLAKMVKYKFPEKVQSGVLEMISPPAFYYPSFLDIKLTFGDSEERVRWRTKQNLDYSFLMLYAQDKGKFYLQLEDDIIAKPRYFMALKDFAFTQTSDWLVLEFSKLGFIGKLFRTRDLPLIVQFLIMFYKDKPIDWLLDHLFYVKICNPEKHNLDCEKQKQKLRIQYKPSLFQHMGKYSSLRGKIQNLQDADFGKQELYPHHSNPPASLHTSLKAHEHYSLENAYLRRGFFWAISPKAGDYILIQFNNPLNIKEYVFTSGNVQHPGDILSNTIVEILPENETDFLSNLLRNGSKFDYEATSHGFFKIGTFENGVAQGIINPAVGKIKAFRLTVLSDSPVWAMVGEVNERPDLRKNLDVRAETDLVGHACPPLRFTDEEIKVNQKAVNKNSHKGAQFLHSKLHALFIAPSPPLRFHARSATFGFPDTWIPGRGRGGQIVDTRAGMPQKEALYRLTLGEGAQERRGFHETRLNANSRGWFFCKSIRTQEAYLLKSSRRDCFIKGVGAQAGADPTHPHDWKEAAARGTRERWESGSARVRRQARRGPGSPGWRSSTPSPLSPEGREPGESRRVPLLAHAPLEDAVEWPAATLVLWWSNHPVAAGRTAKVQPPRGPHPWHRCVTRAGLLKRGRSGGRGRGEGAGVGVGRGESARSREPPRGPGGGVHGPREGGGFETCREGEGAGPGWTQVRYNGGYRPRPHRPSGRRARALGARAPPPPPSLSGESARPQGRTGQRLDGREGLRGVRGWTGAPLGAQSSGKRERQWSPGLDGRAPPRRGGRGLDGRATAGSATYPGPL
ncbi:alpha-1,3-mannosyl-glycoprotein 4-beta-N-acetylglucosaminyltransferase-like protein MGAT4D [Trichosurus vulpecula]|uniref:alpha-1,3-mannosyl-glycoprotein 4-beta-N-acetylglucosaminyltransferase-like protein MGAT4D n=1 Tax=Trichosurus vulpecula TaxID=9337 RepID=UPI00186B568F|nr:alpha-1,3-mannosyl-glycoprotein 4-beta-N-acetylglucosaminyltransferase-like protein MGAT4D [Trichosurus vulpecula]